MNRIITILCLVFLFQLTSQQANPILVENSSVLTPQSIKAYPDISNYRIVCYFPKWAQLQPENIDPFLCTHIIFAYLTIESLKVTTGEVLDETLMRRLAKLREKNPNLKLLIGIGGKSAT
jgi:GH18 family chitinase